MCGVKIVITGVVLMVIQFGLAIAGWGGWDAFFRHPAFQALAGVTVVLAVLAVFSGGGLSTGEKEDRSNRWVLLAFQRDCAVDGFLFVVYRSRWVLDAGRRPNALGGSCGVLSGRTAAHYSGVCVEESLQRAGGDPARASARNAWHL